ncbi:FKBP-type peptidyl-prolyl cis-trans isomerase [Flavivirga abyssicola]|uniref:FKBP-type peptidyl-prolyl cis-trans isomerase n=1 Tax=Flavivirga abyssicola TaxID=3063533 RepID=UPI0026DFEA89|nr:FKBP-type peptidyl-prolyl cis-trans isomerase [Flavivirga sp. MEBiC07777]WVK14126.1 FKBP-type peptidyl-prolyl cis-trans isomerase [Flavivirga sp. MEBiC07777]
MKTIKFLSAAMIALLAMSCNKSGVTNLPLKTQIDSVSYAIGLSNGYQVRAGFEEVNIDLFVQGLKNGADSTNILIEQDKINVIIQTYFQKKQQEEMKKQQEEALKKAEEQFGDNKVENEKFLTENISKDGVETTDSGLQYIVLKEGSGETPQATSRVKVHYHGTRIDGTVFDSSVDRGEPSEFGVNQVIPGWIEGLQLMKVGSKYKFFIPQDLAYGAFPRQGGVIKPFDALIFEVELIEIVK